MRITSECSASCSSSPRNSLHFVPARRALPRHKQPCNRFRIYASKQSKNVPKKTTPKKTLTTRKPSASDLAEEPEWGWFEWSQYANAESWDVPWGWPTIIFGMLAWAVSFVLIGILTVSGAVLVYGTADANGFTPLQESTLALANQVIATIAGLLIVWTIGKRGGEETPSDYLNVSLTQPFKKPFGWATWSIAGLAVAPTAIVVASVLVTLLPETGGRGTVDGVASMISTQVDPSIYMNLLLVTGVLAPILEETVFRGFLMTSLSKYTTVPIAVVTSSIAFAACHLSARDFPQLFALGMVMGFSYARSRNLMTNIIIHGVWNSGVLTLLFVLVNNGTSMEDILGR